MKSVTYFISEALCVTSRVGESEPDITDGVCGCREGDKYIRHCNGPSMVQVNSM
jgi:hypothetical protein